MIVDGKGWNNTMTEWREGKFYNRIRQKWNHRESLRADNRGVTLMEMVVSVAIIGIFAAVVAGFITSGANFYRKSADTVQVQSDMQNTIDTVENQILNASQGITYTDNGDTRVLTTNRRTIVATGDMTPYSDVITWNAFEETLYYERTSSNSSLRVAQTVLAEHVTDFSVDMSQSKSGGVVRFSLTLNKRGKEETQECTVTLRNSLNVTGRRNADHAAEITRWI